MRGLLADQSIKAVFMDYTGTMVKEDEPYTQQLVKYFVTHSDLTEPARALKVVWGMIKHYEDVCYGDTFITNDEMVDRILALCVKDYGLEGDLTYMHELWRGAWVHAPLFDDVKPFFAACPVPIYVVTNDDLPYIEESFEEKDIEPTGVVGAEMVRACKPHLELFEKALEVAGVLPEEAVMVGDSITSDMLPAQALGLHPVLIDRNGTQKEGEFPIIHSLSELLP